MAHLGVARANALQARTLQGADADAARVRTLAAYKDFLALWKDADPDKAVSQELPATSQGITAISPTQLWLLSGWGCIRGKGKSREGQLTPSNTGLYADLPLEHPQ